MSEFFCGLFFFMTGAALLFYNKRLVENNAEYYPRNLRAEKRERAIAIDRVLCRAVGIFVLAAGFLTMYFSNR
jgi:hypothetical protein